MTQYMPMIGLFCYQEVIIRLKTQSGLEENKENTNSTMLKLFIGFFHFPFLIYIRSSTGQ